VKHIEQLKNRLLEDCVAETDNDVERSYCIFSTFYNNQEDAANKACTRCNSVSYKNYGVLNEAKKEKT
jgi:hypothetical protein